MKVFYESRAESLFVGRMTEYAFPLHVHEVVELAYVQAGECDIQLDGAEYTLGPGDAALVFPLVPHSFERLSPDCRGFAAFFPSGMISEFAGIFHGSLPDLPVVRAEKVDDDARLAIARLDQDSEQDHSPKRIAFLHLLMASLLAQMRFHPASLTSEQGLTYRVMKYIFDHACESITLSSAARDLGISESHLSHLFAQQFHINFRRFINAIRIDKARAMMHDPRLTLTDISYSCGYENMRTFRRAFVRETGMLPTAYLRSQTAGPTANH